MRAVAIVSLMLAACAAPQRPACTVVGPEWPPQRHEHASAETDAIAASPSAPSSTSCAGLSIEMRVADARGQREIRFECHPFGADVSVSQGGPEDEGYSESWTLDVSATEALFAELRTVSVSSLRCAAPGSASRLLRIAGPGGAREAACSADEAPSWVALEETLWPARATTDGEDILWPYDSEYWRDELRYAAAAESTSEI